MKYFDQNKPPEIPLDLFQCPICGAQVVFVEINEYETETGKVTDTGFHVSCTTEPEFDDPDYDDWLNGHFSMPYVDWLPLEVKIYKWLSASFRLRLPTLREPDECHVAAGVGIVNNFIGWRSRTRGLRQPLGAFLHN